MRIAKTRLGKSNSGFSLIELMITLVVSSLVLAAVFTAYLSQQRSFQSREQVAEMQQNMRAALMIMSSDIRMAGYDGAFTGNYGVISADISKFVFTADLNDDGGAPGVGETLTYELYTTGGITSLRRIAGQSAVVENIEALEFYYLDDSSPTPNNLGDASGSVSAGSLGDIRSIEISILARAAKPTRKYTNNQTYTAASGVTWGPYSDGFYRRLLITTVNCRNLGL